MSDEEDEERRRRGILTAAAKSPRLTPDEQAFLSAVAKDSGLGLPLTWLERCRVRRLVGRVAAP